MAIKSTLFVLALAFAAVCAEEDFLDDNQFLEISHRVELCLRDVKARSGMVEARYNCATAGSLVMYNEPGWSGVGPAVVECLREFNAPAAQVSEVEQCLNTRLAKPLQNNGPDSYTAAQNEEILGRVQKCLEQQPADGKGTPATTCLDVAQWSLADGNWKEDLESPVIQCLRNDNHSFPQTTIVATQQCLRKELDADLA